MRIQVYVEKSVSPKQLDWAARIRAEGHRVHFALDHPFRKPEVCDAYVNTDKIEIAEAYEAEGIPEYQDSMLVDDADKRESVAKPKKRKVAKIETVADVVEAEIDKKVLDNTGGVGVIDEPPEAA